MKSNKKHYFDIAILTILLLQSIISIMFFAKDDWNVQKVANKIISNVLTITCTYDDLTEAKGTGVIIQNNTILSVAHLFPDSKTTISIIAIKVNSLEEYELTLLKKDSSIDIAILEGDLEGDINFYNSDNVKYGDSILKIGNSLGYGLSLDEGIVSSPYKIVEIEETQRELIQISMQIYSGDSGAPVFNKYGKLIGIVSFKTTTSISTQAELSFIVPSNIIQNFINENN